MSKSKVICNREGVLIQINNKKIVQRLRNKLVAKGKEQFTSLEGIEFAYALANEVSECIYEELHMLKVINYNKETFTYDLLKRSVPRENVERMVKDILLDILSHATNKLTREEIEGHLYGTPQDIE